ncbi:hypothetical protein HMPREF9946_02697 [Acetobacteraceae bacterium AT-5844]|nr:hypothetical protein HMPREF9946_02697 [Acetobacteraceae bacterium AT-5844]
MSCCFRATGLWHKRHRGNFAPPGRQDGAYVRREKYFSPRNRRGATKPALSLRAPLLLAGKRGASARQSTA